MASFRPFVLDKTLFNAGLYKRIHALWFADLAPRATTPSEEMLKRSFGIGSSRHEKEAFDTLVRGSVGNVLASVGPSKYDLSVAPQNPALPFLREFGADTTVAASAALSLIILLDQLARNVFRTPPGLSMVYTHYDRLSLGVLHHVLHHTSPRLDLHPLYCRSPVYRIWFYMPLMHSEAPSDHMQLASLLKDMRAEAAEAGDEAAVAYVEQTRRFEQRHMDIISRFGRYPYRNDVVGRQTTEEERKWLQNGGETFGVSSG